MIARRLGSEKHLQVYRNKLQKVIMIKGKIVKH